MIVFTTIKKVVPAKPKLRDFLKAVQMNNSQLFCPRISHVTLLELDGVVQFVLFESQDIHVKKSTRAQQLSHSHVSIQ
jgi:hypothetical protein